MTIALWCVLIAALMPYVWTVFAKASKPGFDNSNPRVFLDELEGRGKRAHWAQLNGFEAFPAFAAAVLMASFLSNIEQDTLNILAVSFVVCRFLHGVFYVIDQASLRSIVWLLSVGCWVTMFVLSA